VCGSADLILANQLYSSFKFVAKSLWRENSFDRSMARVRFWAPRIHNESLEK